MIDYLGMIKCIELNSQANRARWRENEDAFYEEFGREPFDAGSRLVRRLQHRFRSLIGERTIEPGSRQPGHAKE